MQHKLLLNRFLIMSNNFILEGEDLYKKIEALKQIRVDSDNWLIYYIDDANNEKWVKEYPESEYHGGGRPQLRLLRCFPWEENGEKV